MAAGADTKEFEQMIDNAIAGLGFETVNHRVETALGKFGDIPANGADNAVGVEFRAEDVAMTIVDPVYPLHDADIGKEFEGAEQAGIAEWLATITERRFELGCAKRPPIGTRCIDDGSAWGSQFVACCADAL